jgi:hypothetical protein
MASIEAEGPDVSGEIPQVPINFVPATEGETFALGQLTIRIMEDGSRTGKQYPAHDFASFLAHA